MPANTTPTPPKPLYVERLRIFGSYLDPQIYALGDVDVELSFGMRTRDHKRISAYTRGSGRAYCSEGHERWAASVTPGGRLTTSSTGHGMLALGITRRYGRNTMHPDYLVIPHQEITRWRGQCEGCWHGEFWKRVDSRSLIPIVIRHHVPDSTEREYC
ncbi:hypothetical protein [Pseudarthrobacter sp. SSS035]|uniref:hypothetical protein n=1 Tax=Pseudarthrobacter sp. SSS035 TaxID=2931399 RepID=UPI00200F21DC|nr:hypothetical protein [Pseudarthrobacter sp. SSS035]